MAGDSAGDCVGPDPVMFPLTWTGNVGDFACTEDEAAHFSIATFSYSCQPVNCAAKYVSDDYTFDATCRLCVPCVLADSAACGTFDIDGNSAGISDCISDGSCESVDCGPHGMSTGDFSCECDDGYATDVTLDQYCSVLSNVTDTSDNTQSSASTDAKSVAATGIAITLGVLIVVAAVVTAIVVARRRTVGRIRATEQAVGHLMHMVRRKSNRLTRLQDESSGAPVTTVFHWIDWRRRRRQKGGGRRRGRGPEPYPVYP